MTCNGAPLTRSVIHRRFGQHCAENSLQQVSQHVQIYTPIMLNRPPGGCDEPDPKYHRNASTMETGLYDPVRGCGAACWNILNHLVRTRPDPSATEMAAAQSLQPTPVVRARLAPVRKHSGTRAPPPPRAGPETPESVRTGLPLLKEC